MITYETLTGSTPDAYFMPSATVTENGKSTVYGIDVDGSFVNLDSSNSATYVATDGSAATSDKPTSSDKTKTSEASQADATTQDPYGASVDDSTAYGTTDPGVGGGASADGTSPYVDPYTGQ